MNSQKRVLIIFLQLLSGKTLKKQELMQMFGKTESTIQRDIAIIIDVLTEKNYETNFREDLSIDRDEKGSYRLSGEAGLQSLAKLSDNEILILLKILYSTRFFNKKEITRLSNKLLYLTKDKEMVRNLIANEKIFYEGISTDDLLERISFITDAIKNHGMIKFEYTRNGVTELFQRVPNAVYFSDLYFFMLSSSETARDDADLLSLNKFRINNMEKLQLISFHNKRPYADRFEGGLLRGRTVLPFLGNPITLIFDFYYDPIYVLDRFSESKIIRTNEDGSVRFEVKANDGYGIKMWLSSQSHMVKIISPRYMRDYIIQDMKDTLKLYGVETK